MDNNTHLTLDLDNLSLDTLKKLMSLFDNLAIELEGQSDPDMWYEGFLGNDYASSVHHFIMNKFGTDA